MKNTIIALALASGLFAVSNEANAATYTLSGSGGQVDYYGTGFHIGASAVLDSSLDTFASATFSVKGLVDQGNGYEGYTNGFFLCLYDDGVKIYTSPGLIASHFLQDLTFTADTIHLAEMNSALVLMPSGHTAKIGILAESVGFAGWELHAASTSFRADLTTAIPEPSACALGAVAALGLLVRRRKAQLV